MNWGKQQGLFVQIPLGIWKISMVFSSGIGRASLTRGFYDLLQEKVQRFFLHMLFSNSFSLKILNMPKCVFWGIMFWTSSLDSYLHKILLLQNVTKGSTVKLAVRYKKCWRNSCSFSLFLYCIIYLFSFFSRHNYTDKVSVNENSHHLCFFCFSSW